METKNPMHYLVLTEIAKHVTKLEHAGFSVLGIESTGNALKYTVTPVPEQTQPTDYAVEEL